MPNDQPTRRFRLRFSLRQLFVAVTLVAVGLAGWNSLNRKGVVVRASKPNEFPRGDIWKCSRNVAIVDGKFRKGMSLIVSLHVVEAGVVHEVGQGSVKLFVSHKPTSTWESRTIRLVHGEGKKGMKPGGNVATLGIVVEDDGKRWSTTLAGVPGWLDTIIEDKQTLPGKITPGRPHIVYVEGDQAIGVDGSMSVEGFAKANPGNYLVVTVEVR